LRRFTFFLGVFSVGLVVFLLLTGQFQGTEEPIENTETEPPLDVTEQNHVTHRSYDYSLGRLRFTLRGLVDLSSGLVLSPDNLVNQRAIFVGGGENGLAIALDLMAAGDDYGAAVVVAEFGEVA